MAEYTGYKIIRYIDLNPKSPTYSQTRDERVLDSECSLAEPSWEQTKSYCELDSKGANTGYKITTYTDVNAQSSSYNETKNERVQDETTCPLPSVEPNWVEDLQFDSYCEEKYYEPAHVIGYTGYRVVRLVDSNLFSPTANERVISAITDTETCPPPNTDPILEEITTDCEVVEDEFGNLVLNGYSKTTGLDKNVYSPTYLTVTTVRQLDENCGGSGSCSCDDLLVNDECQCSDLVTVDEPEPPTPTTNFDDLLSQFNEVLSEMGKTQVSSASTPNVYNYLKDGYDRALEEYEGDSELFNESYYDEVYNYHGNNTEYHDTAKNAMLSWLMAMQLSELYADSGVTTNTQTELFKAAYDYGTENGGRSIPVYNENDLHSDVFIARYVASAMYAITRANYTFEQMDSLFRSETNTTPIDRLDSSWTDSKQVTDATCDGRLSDNFNIGYALNLAGIFPAAAGPYADNYYNGDLICRNIPTRHPDGLQPSSQFNPTTENYLVDETIDNIVTSQYNLSASDTNIARTVQAVADDEDDIKQMLGGITYYKYNASSPKTSFEVGTSSDNMGSFKGTFNVQVLGKDLSSLIHNPDGTETDIAYFFGGVAYIGGQSRKTLGDPQYGRRRPGQGEGDALYNGDTVVLDSTPRCLCNSGCNTNLNYLIDTSIQRLVGGGTKLSSNYYYYVDNNGDGEYDSGEPTYGDGIKGTTNECAGLHATTYPSGHSSEIWTVALFLMQMLPSRYKEIYKAAYNYTVSRTIVRAHWNSDTMYGKLVATTMTPIINAFRNAHNGQNVRNFYNAAKTMIDNAPSGGGGEAITVGFAVHNNTSNSITIMNKLAYALYNDNNYGWDGCYNRYNLIDSTELITIPSNSSYTFVATVAESETWTTTRHFLDVDNCQLFKEQYPNNTNVFLYDANGDSSTIIPRGISPSTLFVDSQIYQVYIN
jgi:hypothetical protein